MRPLKYIFLIILIQILGFFTLPVYANTWPMWGGNSTRNFSVNADLPENLELIWSRELGEPARAWPFQFENYYTSGNPAKIGKISFDVSYEPVAAEGKLFVPSMRADKVTAYSADTGEELWRFYVNGPVRLAPVYNNGKLYFTSDDGFLYCVNANSGKFIWKFQGFFSNERNILGNGRLISMWPARGGPVISDGILYFASGVFPFEGIFIHAVDAETGRGIWTNSTSGSMWSLHQHAGAWAYGGISPQGYLAVMSDKLIVAGGRTPPAVYNKSTGEFLYYRQAHGEVGKGAGGYMVSAWDGWFTNHGMLYCLDDGAQYGKVAVSVVTDDTVIGIDQGYLIAHKSELKRKDVEVKDRLGQGAIRVDYELKKLWEDKKIEGIKQLHFKSGQYLVVNLEKTKVGLIKLNNEGVPSEVSWQYDTKEEIWDIIASEGRLFVITESGKIHCFGEAKNRKNCLYPEEKKPYKNVPKYKKTAEQIISQTNIKDGYAIFWGAGDGELIKSLLQLTTLHIVVIEQDEVLVNRLRYLFDDAGDYGQRVALMDGSPIETSLPAYMADLIVFTKTPTEKDLSKAYNSLRPYGGKIYTENPPKNISDIFSELNLENAKLLVNKNSVVIEREGALKGAGQWTHQYADSSNSTYSVDSLVKAPLGVLWFGNTSNLNALPRHQNGPVPQVAGGRLFILGIDTISARCVYTGRELWVKNIPGVGHPFTSLPHEKAFFDCKEVYMPSAPGANFIGSPYVSLKDGVYVIDKEKILLLDPATGETQKEFHLPFVKGMSRVEWGHIMAWEDLLIMTADPQYFDDKLSGDINWNATSSTLLIVLNRSTGKVLWVKKAQRIGFRHNAIVVGNGRLYVIDGLSNKVVETMQRRGVDTETSSLLISFDVRTGKILWQEEKDIFGTWLSYYNDRDMLIQGGRHGQRGAPADEPRNRMIAHRGETGKILWENKQKYSGPVGLHEKMIIPGRPGDRVLDPDTGKVFQIENPITGKDYKWTFFKTYGCGTMNTSRYLISFRSGAAGFSDLLNFGGTGNFGGFKAGCTNNLIAADGLLNAPDYTRTCTCSYQLQTSVGLIHNPTSEMWTLNPRVTVKKSSIKKLGVNFGAPGNRIENGVFWLEHPKIYEGGPDIKIEMKTSSLEWFRNHSTWINNPEEGYAWVGSYGVKGVENISIPLIPEGKESAIYNITLYFVEPEDVGIGKRSFDLYVQGEKVLTNFDISQKAGGYRRLATVKIEKVSVKDNLEISFKQNKNSLPPVISGIEILMDSQ